MGMWRFAAASVAGTAHLKSGSPCQDACRTEMVFSADKEELLVAVVSDGAGSASRAEIGARLACDLFVNEVRRAFQESDGWESLTKGFIAEWIGQFQLQIVLRASEEGLKSQDFACTLVAAVVGANRAIYFHLGDGALVESRRSEAGHYRCASWPQQGEYANTTYFLTDADAASKIVTVTADYAVDEVALLTDGLQAIVLDFRARSAHTPFFAPLFGWLRGAVSNSPAELSGPLAVYLSSEKVNARTDDDKTLILAVRSRG